MVLPKLFYLGIAIMGIWTVIILFLLRHYYLDWCLKNILRLRRRAQQLTFRHGTPTAARRHSTLLMKSDSMQSSGTNAGNNNNNNNSTTENTLKTPESNNLLLQLTDDSKASDDDQYCITPTSNVYNGTTMAV